MKPQTLHNCTVCGVAVDKCCADHPNVKIASTGLIGLDLQRGRSWTRDPIIKTEAHSGWSSGWVARVTPGKPGGKYDLERDFLRYDDCQLSRAGNGSKTYNLDYCADGYYEADSVLRSYEAYRTYFEVRGHKIVRRLESKNELLAAMRSEEVPSAN